MKFKLFINNYTKHLQKKEPGLAPSYTQLRIINIYEELIKDLSQFYGFCFC